MRSGSAVVLIGVDRGLLSAEVALAIYALLAFFYLFDVLPWLEERVGKHG